LTGGLQSRDNAKGTEEIAGKMSPFCCVFGGNLLRPPYLTATSQFEPFALSRMKVLLQWLPDT
jgi:hypothetical protein